MERNNLQPVYECLKRRPYIDPLTIRFCRAAGTEVCDRGCGVYRSQAVEEQVGAGAGHLNQPKQ